MVAAKKVLSERVRKAVAMTPLSDQRIDDAILSVAEESWMKVAFVIQKVAEKLGSDLPEGDAALGRVATRIGILVGDGRLLAQGDIEKWRSSEVRKPG